jgi:glycosyltransferase involved in cell wall biosynthesis
VKSYSLAVVSDATMFSGAERVVEVLLNGLPKNVHAAVIGQNHLVVDRLAAARSGTTPLTIMNRIRPIRQALSRISPDIIHMNLNGMGSCRPAIAAATSLRIPFIVVDHLPASQLRLRARLLQRLITQLSAARVSVGRRSSRFIEQLVGLPYGTVRTIHNAVPPLPVKPSQPVPGVLRVATLCRLVPDKGVDILLRAMAELPQVTAQIAGSGDSERELKVLAEKLGLASRVRFHGWSDPVSVLSSADVLVLPSRNEGLPLVLLESMQAGFPVIAACVGSVAEIVEDRVTGLLVPPDDVDAMTRALVKLLSSSGLRLRLGAEARTQVSARFSVSEMICEYDRLYRDVLAQRSLPRRRKG